MNICIYMHKYMYTIATSLKEAMNLKESLENYVEGFLRGNGNLKKVKSLLKIDRKK